MPANHWNGELAASLLDNLTDRGFTQADCINLLVVIARLENGLAEEKRLSFKDMAVAHGLLCRFTAQLPTVVDGIVEQHQQGWIEEMRETLQPSAN